MHVSYKMASGSHGSLPPYFNGIDSSSAIVLSSGDECMSDKDVYLFPAPKSIKLEDNVLDDADGSDLCDVDAEQSSE